MADVLIVLLLVGILLAIGIAGVFVFRKSCRNKKTDYYMFFVMGVVLFPVGLVFAMTSPGFMGLMALGLIYMAIGLRHKHEWKREQKRKRTRNK